MKKLNLRLFVALGFVLLGFVLVGCDGGGTDSLSDTGVAAPDGGFVDVLPGMGLEVAKIDTWPSSSGLGRTDAGMIFCDIPSPTGDTVDSVTGLTFRQLAMNRATAGTFISFVVIANDPLPVCLAAPGTTSAICSDAAHDFQTPSGNVGCWMVGMSKTDPTRCSGGGTQTCAVWALGMFPSTTTWKKETALCSPGGVFLGWQCSN